MGQFKTLHNAKKARYNEFYTPRETVEDFLPKIAPYLKGKSVWCFADGFESEFTKWFIANFDAIGLHKLLCTSQSKDGGLAILKEAGQGVKSWKLKNDGSLFSAEVHELSRGCDVVVTNPPFSGMHSILRFISDRDLNYAVIAPFFTIQTLAEEHSKPTRIYCLSSNEFIIPDAAAHRFGNATPYSLDPSRGLAVHICQAVWLTSFDAGKMPTLPKSSESFASLQAKGKVDDYIGFNHNDIIEVSRCKCIPNDIPDTTLLSMPTSVLCYDLEASGYEFAGGTRNGNQGLIRKDGKVFLGKHSLYKKSTGKIPWWRLFIQKKGSNAAQLFASKYNLPCLDIKKRVRHEISK